jgi:hypothetical protein
MWRFSSLAEKICATEEGLQNIELVEYKQKDLNIVRKHWSLKDYVMDFGTCLLAMYLEP